MSFFWWIVAIGTLMAVGGFTLAFGHIFNFTRDAAAMPMVIFAGIGIIGSVVAVIALLAILVFSLLGKM